MIPPPAARGRGLFYGGALYPQLWAVRTFRAGSCCKLQALKYQFQCHVPSGKCQHGQHPRAAASSHVAIPDLLLPSASTNFLRLCATCHQTSLASAGTRRRLCRFFHCHPDSRSAPPLRQDCPATSRLPVPASKPVSHFI